MATLSLGAEIKSSFQNYAAVTRHLKEFEFETKYKLDFETINLDFLYSYVTYLQKEEAGSKHHCKKHKHIKGIYGRNCRLGIYQ